LTIAGLTDEHFEIAIIPKTWEVTNLSHLKPGDEVNIEVDVLGKYIEKLLQSQSPKRHQIKALCLCAFVVFG
jgi:riboflavin synthase